MISKVGLVCGLYTIFTLICAPHKQPNMPIIKSNISCAEVVKWMVIESHKILYMIHNISSIPVMVFYSVFGLGVLFASFV